MFANCLKALNRNTFLLQFCGNSWLNTNRVLASVVAVGGGGVGNGSRRLVHSSNTHEIDYLLTKYKLTILSDGSDRSYGNRCSLHHFNRVDNNFDLKYQKDITIETLRRVLEIRKSDAQSLVKNYPSLVELSAKRLEQQVRYLEKEYQLTLDHFWSCPWILYLPSNFITERLKPFIQQEITSDHLVLLLLPMNIYENVIKKIKKNTIRKDIFNDFNQKLNLFTNNLEIIEEEFCDLVHENSFLFYYDFQRLEDVMQLLKKADINVSLIMADIRTFNTNIEVMKERIDKCLKHQVKVKTWMLRATEESFNICVQRHVDNKIVMKDIDNSVDFIAKQLKCGTKIVEYMMHRYPRIVRISSKMLFDKLSFLFKSGFTSHHIIDTPKILFHSVDTILQRVQQLEAIDIQLNSLKILTLSEKEYQKLFLQLKTLKDGDSGNDSDESESK